MSQQDLTFEVKAFVREQLGADLVGIAPVERFEKAPEGHKPEDILPGARSVIVFAYDMLESTFKSPKHVVYSLRYWELGRRVQFLGYDLCRFIDHKGYYAIYLQSTAPLDMSSEGRGIFADFSYKHAAVEAGIGEMGWNRLLITPQFGPRVWLSAAITTAPLTPDPRFEQSLCPRDDCRICLDECPVGALTPETEEGIDKRKCLRAEDVGLYAVLKHIKGTMLEQDPQKKLDRALGPKTWNIWQDLKYGMGYGDGCNRCMAVCPIGKGGKS